MVTQIAKARTKEISLTWTPLLAPVRWYFRKLEVIWSSIVSLIIELVDRYTNTKKYFLKRQKKKKKIRLKEIKKMDCKLSKE